MFALVYLVSADSVPLRAKDVTAKVIKDLEKEYNLVDVANFESKSPSFTNMMSR
ncbi:hypothetical protein WAI453_003929 [Rhynchosporium graminicola]